MKQTARVLVANAAGLTVLAGADGAGGGEAVEKVGPMENPAPYWTSAQAPRATTTTAVQALLARRRAQVGGAGLRSAQRRQRHRLLSELEKGSVERCARSPAPGTRQSPSGLQRSQRPCMDFVPKPPLLALSKLAEARRWSPIAKLIEDSETSLATGDRAASEEEKAAQLRRGWSSARIAQGAILREAGEGKPASLRSSKKKSLTGADPSS